MTGRDDQVIFAFVRAEDAVDGVPTLTFMMPEQSWHHLKDGRSHEFNLTNVGIPLRVLIGRTANHASGMLELEKINGGAMHKARYMLDVDMHFGQKPKH